MIVEREQAGYHQRIRDKSVDIEQKREKTHQIRL